MKRSGGQDGLRFDESVLNAIVQVQNTQQLLLDKVSSIEDRLDVLSPSPYLPMLLKPAQKKAGRTPNVAKLLRNLIDEKNSKLRPQNKYLQFPDEDCDSSINTSAKQCIHGYMALLLGGGWENKSWSEIYSTSKQSAERVIQAASRDRSLIVFAQCSSQWSIRMLAEQKQKSTVRNAQAAKKGKMEAKKTEGPENVWCADQEKPSFQNEIENQGSSFQVSQIREQEKSQQPCVNRIIVPSNREEYQFRTPKRSTLPNDRGGSSNSHLGFVQFQRLVHTPSPQNAAFAQPNHSKMEQISPGNNLPVQSSKTAGQLHLISGHGIDGTEGSVENLKRAAHFQDFNEEHCLKMGQSTVPVKTIQREDISNLKKGNDRHDRAAPVGIEDVENSTFGSGPANITNNDPFQSVSSKGKTLIPIKWDKKSTLRNVHFFAEDPEQDVYLDQDGGKGAPNVSLLYRHVPPFPDTDIEQREIANNTSFQYNKRRTPESRKVKSSKTVRRRLV